MFADYCFDKTKAFIMKMPKDARKEYGQFFTEPLTADFMASLFSFEQGSSLRVLDPGAGTGLLSAAFAEAALKAGVRKIELVCYENDTNVLPLLNETLSYVASACEGKMDFVFEIRSDHYLLTRSETFPAGYPEDSFDCVIGNPPYKKIGKDSEEAKAMPEVCYGSPNLYFLFCAMSISDLKEGGELVYIIPRSWVSGAYFKEFRRYLFSVSSPQQIHLFVSRDKVFDSEPILQETIIIKLKKQTSRDPILISSSGSSSFENVSTMALPFSAVVSGEDQYVFLPTSQEDMVSLGRINGFQDTLVSDGFKMKTGLVVGFRNGDVLDTGPKPGVCPLFFARHISGARVSFPSGEEPEYAKEDKKGFVQRNQNYLLVKRFTSKEERRRLQCSMSFAADLPGYEHVSTDNKINFITSVDGDMSDEELAGLYVIFNSSDYDRYYRVMNGSTQVNSSEANSMPMPDRATISRLGRRFLEDETASVDKIMEEELWQN